MQRSDIKRSCRGAEYPVVLPEVRQRSHRRRPTTRRPSLNVASGGSPAELDHAKMAWKGYASFILGP